MNVLERLAVLPPGLFAAGGTRLSGRAYIVLVLLCVAFFTQGIATLPPTDRDESLFAQASKQMIESGNYVDIRFQDQPRYKKPVGIYWLQAASVRLLNPHHLDQIWAYRVPSLLGATLAVMMTACLGSLLFGPAAGFLAAVMMGGCLILNVEARLAKTDAALLGSIMVMQYALARAYMFRFCHPRASGDPSASVREPRDSFALSREMDSRFRGNDKWSVFFAFWTALGAGILLKGPIILLVLLSTLLWLRLTEKNLAWFVGLKPLIGVPYTLALIAPWFAAIIFASHGAFVEQSAGHDLLGKLWQDQGRGFMPPGAYLLAFPFTFFPFALWALLAAPDSWLNRRTPAVRFCLGWIIPVWIAFELVPSKLPHYTLPVYPAIAMLAAKFLLDGYPALTTQRFRWLPPVVASLWVVVGTGVALAAAILTYILDHRWNAGPVAAGLLIVIAQGASLLLFFRRRESGVIVMAASSLIFMASLFGATLPRLQAVWVSSRIVQAAGALKPCAGPLQIVSTYDEPSLVFLAGDATLLRPSGQMVADEMQKNPCLVGAVENNQRADFMNAFAHAPRPPQAAATIDGFVLARGRRTEIELFLMPEEKAVP